MLKCMDIEFVEIMQVMKMAVIYREVIYFRQKLLTGFKKLSRGKLDFEPSSFETFITHLLIIKY